jgi:U3 small nucleolar RNA-associated protein 25
VLWQADTFLMQNWEHVDSMFDLMNLIPKRPPAGCDFSRVRETSLNGLARHLRQTVVFSSVATPELNSVFNRHMTSAAGRIKAKPRSEGILTDVQQQIKQVFLRLPKCEIVDADERRFEYFVQQIYPRIRDKMQTHTMIFIPHYFDFVRLRNFFRREETLSFCSLCEYTKQSDISRGRSNFYHGRRAVMLYTERIHFFRRLRIRGIESIVFYGLPVYAHFYAEMLNLMSPGAAGLSCQVSPQPIQTVAALSDERVECLHSTIPYPTVP